MAFHKDECGAFGKNLPCDLNGNVPEPGDEWTDFAWPADDSRRFSENPRAWKTFVEKAVAETEAARAAAQHAR
jgi:phytoene/squalene synthetase